MSESLFDSDIPTKSQHMITNTWWECGIAFEIPVLPDVRRMSPKSSGSSRGKSTSNSLVHKSSTVHLIDDFLLRLKRIKCSRVGTSSELVLPSGYA